MNIQKQTKRMDKSNISMTLTVPKDEVNAAYKDMMKDYTKNVQLPGFRKGHVPQEVLERKYGDALKQDALGRIIESAMHEIFEDKDLPREERPLPYANPELQGEPELSLDKDFEFTVVYDVIPEVKIGSWKGLKAEYAYAEVTKADIDKELEGIRERNAVVMDKDDKATAKKGDVVTIDYRIFEEDGLFTSETSGQTNLQRKDFAFTLGSNTNPYQFDEDIEGMKKGETKEFEKKFPDDYFEKDLAGKKRKVSITLTALKEKKLPDLDDDLAQDVDEKFKTLDDLKNNIKEKLEKALEVRIRDTKTAALLEKIMENTPVVLPESMVKAEIEGRWRRLAQYYGTDQETMINMMRQGDDKHWRETSVKALHSRLIIETLIEEQKIEVSDEDAEKEIERIASENNTTAEEVKKHYDEQAMLYLKEEIKERRLIDIMFENNTLKQGKKENFLDFMNKAS